MMQQGMPNDQGGMMPGMMGSGEMQQKMARMMDNCNRMMESMMQNKGRHSASLAEQGLNRLRLVGFLWRFRVREPDEIVHKWPEAPLPGARVPTLPARLALRGRAQQDPRQCNSADVRVTPHLGNNRMRPPVWMGETHPDLGEV